MTEVQVKWEGLLEQLSEVYSAKRSVSTMSDPLLLFILVPELPKRALVEVKPTLFIMKDDDTESESELCIQDQAFTTLPNYWGFREDSWHDFCLQKCIVMENICAVMLSINSEHVAKVCDNSFVFGQPLSEGQTEKIAKFCIYLINKILTENLFSWKNAMYFRIYYQVGSFIQMETLSLIFKQAFEEFAEINPKFEHSNDPIFNLVPVLGSGRSATSMDAMLTCELLAQKSSC